MAETKTGVAQRVLSAIPGNPKLTEVEAICCHAGAEEMLKHLSAEARAILGQYKELEANAKATHDYHSASIYETTIEGMETLADNLGLDLEGEDS